MKKDISYRCCRCKWYDSGQCGLVYHPHFKEWVDPYNRDCPDWTDKRATEGKLNNGSVWKEYGSVTVFGKEE